MNRGNVDDVKKREQVHFLSCDELFALGETVDTLECADGTYYKG